MKMAKVIVKKSGKKGKGVFALRNFKKGELIFRFNLTKLKKYTLKEISKFPPDKSDHCDYAGRGKYTMDFMPGSYMNHSCDPNTYVEMKTLGKKEIIVLHPIKKGDELTHDYTLNSVDQIRKDAYHWKMKCYCRSKNCRKTIQGNFFKLPKKIQKEKLSYLPTWFKKKYRKQLHRIRSKFQ